MFIEFRPKASRQLALLLAGFHLLAATALVLSVPYKPALAALLLVTLWSWYRANRLHVQRRGRHAVRRAVWQVDGQWQLDDSKGETHSATLMPTSYLHPRLVILNFKLGSGGRRNLVLMPDSLDATTLRQLRVRLRIEALGGDAAASQA